MSLHSRVKRRGLEPRSGQRAHPRARRRTGPRDTRREHTHEGSPAAHARRAHRLFVAGRRVSNSKLLPRLFPARARCMMTRTPCRLMPPLCFLGYFFEIFTPRLLVLGLSSSRLDGHLGHPPDCSPRSLDFGRAERMESIETQAPPVPCLHSDRVSRRSSAVRWNAEERRDDRSQQRALSEVRFTRAFPRPIRRVRWRERASAHSATSLSRNHLVLLSPSTQRGDAGHPPRPSVDPNDAASIATSR